MRITSSDPDGYRGVESAAARLRDTVPLPLVEEATRDAVQLTWGEEYGVIALVTPEAVEVRLPTVEWVHGAYGPRASSRLWRRVRIRRGYGDAELERVREAIVMGLLKREAEFVPCRFCGEPTPPEHRTGKACHGCASTHLGVVY